jgi:hypothetical protein
VSGRKPAARTPGERQSQFGIKPFKAFMGALKVRDDVEVELEVPLPSGG